MADQRLEWLHPPDGVTHPIFRYGPGEFLCKAVVERLKLVPQFKAIFEDAMDEYERQDYSFRELPALRVYSAPYVKEFESWFINGDLIADLLLPASLRRDELNQVPATISAALMQQFRRKEFFNQLCEDVPGLNELGKRFSVDPSMMFTWDENTQIPVTQHRINFRIDLRAWDDYLISRNLTKNDPFEETLGDLTKLVGVIQGLRDQQDVEISIPTSTKPGSGE